MSLILEGKVWKLGDNIDTDVILPGTYLNITDNNELAVHALEGLEDGYAQRFNLGDILVGGSNFGCGSSREQAPAALKAAGISAVIAQEFARIFYRNAINVGLLVLECDGIHSRVDEGDFLSIDAQSGQIQDRTNNLQFKAKPVPDFLLEIIDDGGLIPHLKKTFK